MRKLNIIALLLLSFVRMTAQTCTGYSNKVAAKSEFKSDVVFDRNVGIGTCSPGYRLDVVLDSSTGTACIHTKPSNGIYVGPEMAGAVMLGDYDNAFNKTNIGIVDSLSYLNIQADQMKINLGEPSDSGFIYLGHVDSDGNKRNYINLNDPNNRISVNTDSFYLEATWTNLIDHVGGIVHSSVGGSSVSGTTFVDLFQYTTIPSNRFNLGDSFTYDFTLDQASVDEMDSLKLVATSLNDATVINLVKCRFFARGGTSISVTGSCQFRVSDTKCVMRVSSGDSTVHVFANQSSFDPSHSYQLVLQGATGGNGGAFGGYSSLIWFWPKKEDAW